MKNIVNDKALPALGLVKRAIFYKVGHHASHNGTIKMGGLELMENSKLTAFIPLDERTAKKQGRKDANGKPKGWDMPAMVHRSHSDLPLCPR
jgi:hypothetical protein